MLKGYNESDLPSPDINFEVHAMDNVKEVYKSIQTVLRSYKSENRGPTAVLLQSFLGILFLLYSTFSSKQNNFFGNQCF